LRLILKQQGFIDDEKPPLQLPAGLQALVEALSQGQAPQQPQPQQPQTLNGGPRHG
jgi:hypothetical protein